MPYFLDIIWHKDVVNTVEYHGLCLRVLGADAGVVHHSTRSAAGSDAAKAGLVSAMDLKYERAFRE